MIGWQVRIAALSKLSHSPDGRNRATAVVPAFDTPRCDRRIVHGSAERKISFDIPFEVVACRTDTAYPSGRRGMIVCVVQHTEPVPRWCFGRRPICPELSQHPRIITPWYQFRSVGKPCLRIQVMTRTAVAPAREVEEIR